VQDTSRHRIERHRQPARGDVLLRRGPHAVGRDVARADVISFSVTRAQSTWLIPRCIGGDEWPRGKGCAIFCSSGNDAAGWFQSVSPSQRRRPHDPVDYNKVTDAVECDDTSWLDGWFTRTASVESFEGGGLPVGWTTAGDTHWTYVTNGVGVITHGRLGRDELPRAPGRACVRQPAKLRHGRQRHACRRDELQSLDLSQYTNGCWMSGWMASINTATPAAPPSRPPLATPPARLTPSPSARSTDFDYRADFSDYGANLDFLAPGGGASRESPPPTAPARTR